MRFGPILFALGILVAGSVAVPYAREFWSVDGCVAGGGSFNYDVSVCDHSENHPYVPFAARHAHAVPTLIAGSGLVVLGLVVEAVRRLRR